MFHGGIILGVPLEEDLLGWVLWWDYGSSIFTILCCIQIYAAEYISAFNRSCFYLSTHWSRVTHICVGKLTTIGSVQIIHAFSFTKMHLETPSGKWLSFCLGLNVLKVKWDNIQCCVLDQNITLKIIVQHALLVFLVAWFGVDSVQFWHSSYENENKRKYMYTDGWIQQLIWPWCCCTPHSCAKGISNRRENLLCSLNKEHMCIVH